MQAESKGNSVIQISLKVVPRAGKRGCVLDKNGKLKCFLTSPPEDGKANKELIAFLAKSWRCAQSDILIIRGATSRTKVLEVRTTRTYEQLLMALGCEVQRAVL